ncbi:MAG TPA: hypothetical protein DEP66_05290, partial [Acidimicrobiaceae bacterium]|nr:hypothetical protein [Acidimicrobiaceae bacterium]
MTTLAATDADNDGLTWTTTGGADTARLGVSTAGLLSFEDIPDYENPRDADGDNVYEITVMVTDDGDPPRSATLAVSVTVRNVDEAGTVTIAPSAAPRVGDVLTASVADIDVVVDGTTTWQWESSTDGTGYAPISNALAAAYTPAPPDAGRTLRVVAVYTDGHGAGKTATSDPTPTVPELAVLSVVGGPVFTGETVSGTVTYLNEGDTLVLTVSAEQEPAADSLADAVTIFGENSPLVGLDLVAGAGNHYTATYTVAAGHNVGSGDLAVGIDGVRDTDGNQFARFHRSFPGLVVDTRAPVIGLLGDATVTLAFGDPYTELADPVSFPAGLAPVRVVAFAGATVADVDTGTAGTYTVTYTVTDPAGNAASVSRTVVVEAVPLSADASLSALTMVFSRFSSGDPIELTPAFSPDVLAYVVNVPIVGFANALVTPTSRDSRALSVRVNGRFIFVDAVVSLSSPTVTILVTAEDGTTQKTYTVTVNRHYRPRVPASLEAVVAGQTVTLAWTPPDGGDTVDHYEWQRSTDGDVWTQVVGGVAARSVVVGDIPYGRHTFHVRAVNVVGGEGTTATVAVEVLSFAEPDKPTLTVSRGDGEADLEWDVPESNGATITGYDVRWRRTDTPGTWLRDYPALDQARDLLSTRIRTYRAPGLANGVSHTFQVRVVTEAGVAVDSDEVEATPEEQDTVRPVVLVRSGTAAGAALPAFGETDSVANSPRAGEHRLILILTDDHEVPTATHNTFAQVDPDKGYLIFQRPSGQEIPLTYGVFGNAVVVGSNAEVEAFLCLYGRNPDADAADPCAATPDAVFQLETDDQLISDGGLALDVAGNSNARTTVTVVVDPDAPVPVPAP